MAGSTQGHDAVVVGAGLAGLRCAVVLQRAGLDVVVLEAADAAGGRIRTDVVDGFRVDRGFQLLNPAYPAVRRWVDVDALRLQPLPSGVAARVDDGLVRLGHPLRAPALLAPSAGAALRRPRELAALARLVAPLLVPRRGRTLSDVLAHRAHPTSDLPTPAPATLGAALDRVGLDGLLRRVIAGFLAGVVLDDELGVAEDFALLLLWSFLRGAPSLPAAGMQALPEQLAAGLGDRVRLGVRAGRVSGSRVETDSGTYEARAVVVATGAAEARALTGIEVPAPRGVVTTWWAADVAPSGHGLLHVDARRPQAGPVVNCAVVSHAAPSYAPSGRHLVQTSALIGGARPTPDDDALRRHAADLLGATDAGAGWQVVARHEVPHALPAQPPPYSARRPVDPGGDGTLVCGDHRDTASIQGALVSGQRAADAVLARLGAPAEPASGV